MGEPAAESAAEPRAGRRDPEDAALMARVASGEPGAVAALYDRFAPLVYRMAVQTLNNRTEAEDAVQEVFTRLWGTAERYDPERAALVTWVMLITRRHLVDRLRRSRARVSAVQLDSAWAQADRPSEADLGPEQKERYARLMKRVRTLPELQRTVVMRSYLSGQTLRQISEEQGVPLGTVKSALSRALLRLRERFGEDSG